MYLCISHRLVNYIDKVVYIVVQIYNVNTPEIPK